MQILVVEDDRHLAAALVRILQDAGHQAEAVYDGEQGVFYATMGTYDVVIMDVMLPKLDGFAATEKLRRANVGTPILLLTARDATRDKITGYDSGTDDYMTKPFSPAELLAHLRALERRQNPRTYDQLAAGDLTLNLESYELSCGANRIHLSHKEFCIAKILLSSPGSIVSKETLINKAWGANSTAMDNNVEAYISFLRKKLGHLESQVKIETVRNAGYRLAAANVEPPQDAATCPSSQKA